MNVAIAAMIAGCLRHRRRDHAVTRIHDTRLLGDLEENHLPQTFSIATRVAHDGIRIAVTSVRIALSNLKVHRRKRKLLKG